ncbi:MAG: hypothetical protein IT448_03425 [Phycisphaerales bacterium]|nr:hypothetical protein [Phycisphaerales bacterium]
MKTKPLNQSLHAGKTSKQDEFYTQHINCAVRNASPPAQSWARHDKAL